MAAGPVARALLLGWWVLAGVGCRSARPERPSGGDGELLGEGLASFYGKGFDGKLTASGERFDKDGKTAAHRKLKFGTCLEVENVQNRRRARVRVNDRGPYAGNRIIDVSEGAARQLGMIEAGVARVRLYRCG